MKCFAHSSDLDGHCSGAIIKHRYPDCEMFGINYGDEFPWGDITVGETVYMVDFSLSADEMDRLNKICNLIWIDHHRTAIVDVDHKIKGIRREGLGACALVWEYLFPGHLLPYGVQLLAEYDVWNHKDANTLPFQYGIRIKDCTPSSELWRYLFLTNNKFIMDVVATGENILKYEDQSNAMYAKGVAFETTLDDLKCIAINKMYNNSKLFDSVWDEDKYDAMLSFGRGKDEWRVSLYSTRVDVSKTAVKYGGGGHVHACGFSCDKLPFKFGEK